MRAIFTLLFTIIAFPVLGVEIDPGTHILLRLEHSVSIQTAKPGDFVHFRTASPVAGIPTGSYATGVITLVKHAALFHKNAELEINLVCVTLVDGTVLQVKGPTSSVERPPDRRSSGRPGLLLLAPLAGAAAGGVTGLRIGAGVGIAAALLAPIVARGHDIELRQGSALDAVVTRP